MKLATFTDDRSTRIGIVIDDSVIDLALAAPEMPQNMVAFLEAGERSMRKARKAVERGEYTIPLARVHLEAPVLRPGKFLGIGENYYLRHAVPEVSDDDFREIQARRAEARAKGHPLWFNKQVTCVNGPYDPVELPALSNQVFPEVELAFVIGRRCRNVAKEEAARVIAGYTICNDFTVADWAGVSPTATLGKSFDTHGPLGPWIVTGEDIGDPHSLNLRALVNGEERLAGNSSDMIFNCFELIAYASRVFTFEPGDIVTTGMPSLGWKFLKPGDVVRCEIERIGCIENRVVEAS